MSTASIKAGEAWVSVTAKTDQLRGDLDKASSIINDAAERMSDLNVVVNPQVKTDGIIQFGSVVDSVQAKMDKWSKQCLDFSVSQGKIFLAFAATVGGVAFSFASMGDKFEKMSHRTGMSAESLSEYSHVAGLCGASIEDIESAVRGMQKTMTEAGRGSAEARKKLSELGLSFEYLQTLSPEEQFNEVLQAIAGLENPTTRAGAAMKIFEDAGSKLLPMLDAGSDAIAEMRQEAHDLGITFDDNSSSKSATLCDSFDKMKKSGIGFANMLGDILAPIMIDLFDDITRCANYIREAIKPTVVWTTCLQHWAVRCLGVAAGLGALSLAVAAVIKIFSGFVSIGSNVIKLIQMSIPLFASLTTQVYALSAAFMAASVAEKTLVLTGVIAGVALLTAGIYKLITSINKASNDSKQLGQNLDEIADKNTKLRNNDFNKFKLVTFYSEQATLENGNGQFERGKKLIEELQAKYGDLGITVDEAAKRIQFAADTQDRFNQVIKNDAIKDVNAQIAQEESELAKWQKELNRYKSMSEYSEGAAESEWWDVFGVTTRDVRDEKIAENEEKVAESIKRLNELKSKREDVQNSVDAGLGKSLEEIMNEEMLNLDENSIKKLEDEIAKTEKDWRREQMSNSEKQIEEINEETEALKELLKTRIAIEEAKPEAARDKEYLDHLKKMLQESDAIRNDRIDVLLEQERSKKSEEDKKRLDDVNKKRAEAQRKVDDSAAKFADYEMSDFDKKIKAIEKETALYKEQLDALIKIEEETGKVNAAKEHKEERALLEAKKERRIQKLIEEEKKSLHLDENNIEITRMKSEYSNELLQGNYAKAGRLGEQIFYAENQQKFNELQKKKDDLDKALKELDEAKKTGDDRLIIEAAKNVEGYESDFAASLDSVKNLMTNGGLPSEFIANEIETGLAQQDQRNPSSRGTFNALEASQLGGTTYEKKLVKQSELATDYLRKINDKVDQQTARFS